MSIVYISPNGNDNNEGNKSSPLASLSKAQQLINEGGEIVFLPGNYLIKETQTFSIKASKEKPIIIRSESYEETVFTGCIELNINDIEKISNNIAERLIDKSMSDRVLSIDLKKYDIKNLGNLTRYGFNLEDTIAQAELYINGKRQTLSKWPKESTVQFCDVIDEGPTLNSDEFLNRGGIVKYDFDRPKLWGNESDIWIDGILGFDWEHTHNKVAHFDIKSNNMMIAYGEISGIQKITEHKHGVPLLQNRFYFENLFCELSLPGEYFIDRDNQILYFIPPTHWDNIENIELTSLETPLFDISGAENIIIDGLNINISRDSAIIASGCSGVVIKNCNISNIAGNGIVMGGNYCAIENCTISNVGGSGIILSGGDRKDLTGGSNIVKNCTIHNNGNRYCSYHPAVVVRGVNHIITRNVIFNNPHMAITFSGNDHLFEYNEFFNSISYFRDMGAIYNADHSGCRRGTIIRRNYFHHIGNDGEYKKMGAIYPDWCTMGITIEENIFYKIGSSNTEYSTTIFNNGGSYIITRNNLFIDCPKPYFMSFWLNGWGANRVQGLMENWKKEFENNDFDAQPHFKHYPELKNFWKENRVLPNTNIFSNNTFYFYELGLEFNEPKFYCVQYGENDLLKATNNIELLFGDIGLNTNDNLFLKAIINAFKDKVNFDISLLECIGVEEVALTD